MPITTKLGRAMSYHEVFPPIASYYPLSTWFYKVKGQIKISRDLPYHNAYGHQICKGLLLGAPTVKVIWSFSRVVLWVTWQIEYVISPFAEDLWAKN